MLTNRVDILIEFGECDPSGIVYNPHYFRWFDTGLHAMLRKAGFEFRAMLAERGADGIPLVDMRAKFHLPSRYGDRVVMETSVTKLSRCAFDLRHRLLRGEQVAVEGFETRVWTVFDAAEGRIKAAPLPADIITALSGD